MLVFIATPLTIRQTEECCGTENMIITQLPAESEEIHQAVKHAVVGFNMTI